MMKRVYQGGEEKHLELQIRNSANYFAITLDKRCREFLDRHPEFPASDFPVLVSAISFGLGKGFRNPTKESEKLREQIEKEFNW